MAEYASFKKFPSNHDAESMRSYLFKKLDMNYLAKTQDGDYLLTDDFVFGEYKDAMEEVEKEMETKKDLNPGYKDIQEVAVEDL